MTLLHSTCRLIGWNCFPVCCTCVRLGDLWVTLKKTTKKTNVSANLTQLKLKTSEPSFPIMQVDGSFWLDQPRLAHFSLSVCGRVFIKSKTTQCWWDCDADEVVFSDPTKLSDGKDAVKCAFTVSPIRTYITPSNPTLMDGVVKILSRYFCVILAVIMR